MRRIQKAYEGKFRSLLRQFGARRPELGVRRLLEEAKKLSARKQILPSQALNQIDQRLLQQLDRWRGAKGISMARSAYIAPDGSVPPKFLCDAGLGGLARWLRAAGYEARWLPDIQDDQLLNKARQASAVILTTDSMLMERRLVRDGVIPAVWVPPSLSIGEQLAIVFRELRLAARPPRCMSCGGELRVVDKEQMRDRIPPRTYRWRDLYYVCTQCDKLFWHGTHWQKISQRLEELAPKR